MRRTLVAIIMLAGLGWAQPAKKVAMVLKVAGTVTHQSDPVVTGQLWAPGDSIKMAPGSQVTVLMLNKGERQEISGKGSLEVASEGLKLNGCTARTLSSTQLRLGLNGENHRQIGGLVLRDSASAVINSVLDQIEIASSGLKISRPAEAGNPPGLQFRYFKLYENPIINPELTSVKVPPIGDPKVCIYAPEVRAQRQGDRWVWDVPWPLEGPPVHALEVLDTAANERRLYTRVYHANAKEQSELSAARKKVADWAKQEPGTIGPAVYMANLLEEKGQLEGALEALKPALALQPKDTGLVQMRARLLIDLGRYADAAAALKAIKK